MAIFYLDPLNGSDSDTSPLGWWRAVVTVTGGSLPAAGATATGGTSGATAKLTIQPGSWAGVVSCYFYGKSGTFVAETITFTGGATATITGDLVYVAWKNITTGATAARITAGDTIRIAKSPAPYSIGTGVWTSNTGIPNTKNIVSSTNATPIVVTCTAHGYSNGGIVQVVGHTTNTNANGVWKVANVTANTFELVGSVGNGVGGASGTVRDLNYKSVVLSTAKNAVVYQCEAAFTAAGASTCTTSTTAKEGALSCSIQKTTPATATLYGYRTIASTNLSAYQNVTFWIRPNVAITAGQWTLTFCSDTAGVTAVDTFAIPALPIANQWAPLTIARNGGGNLGAAIQSIGLKTGATTPATITILLDNICVSTTGGLNLQSLISPSDADQIVDQPWLPIQSINGDGTILVIDSGTNTAFNTGYGYYGTTQTVTTYARESHNYGQNAAGNQSAATESGTAGNPISYVGGYNIATNIQDGESLFHGMGTSATGFSTSVYSYIHLDRLGYSGYSIGISIGGSSARGITAGTLSNLVNCNSAGIIISTYSHTIDRLINSNNNALYGIQFSGAGLVQLNSVENLNCNTANGILYGTASFISIYNCTNICANGGNGVGSTTGGHSSYYQIANINYNNGVGFDSGVMNNRLVGTTFTGNVSASVRQTNGGNLYLENCTSNDTTEISAFTAGTNNNVAWYDYDTTANDHRIFTYNGSVVTDATTRHTASDFSWKAAPLSGRDIYEPIRLKVAEIPCNAGALVTFKAWVKLDHATNIAAAIVCPKNQVSGVSSDVVANKAADTNWEELTITFTPTEQKVVEIYFVSWYVSGNSNAYIDDLTITQA